jgi:hypothetical protein
MSETLGIYQDDEGNLLNKQKFSAEATAQSFKELIHTLQKLPEFLVIREWLPEQSSYLKNQRSLWRLLGARVDYLHQIRLGDRPKDPISKISHPTLKKKVEVYSNLCFWLLQVVIDSFDDIQRAATAEGKPFSFQSPKELFIEICKEFSNVPVAEATSRDVGVGKSLGWMRGTQTEMGRIYRGTLPQAEMEKNLQFLKENAGWGGFTIASILSGSGAKYLRKPATPQGQNWKRFQEAHKDLVRFLKQNDVATLKWNVGHPVWSQSNTLVPPS